MKEGGACIVVWVRADNKAFRAENYGTKPNKVSDN